LHQFPETRVVQIVDVTCNNDMAYECQTLPLEISPDEVKAMISNISDEVEAMVSNISDEVGDYGFKHL
jgi:hypothetical protein